MVRANSTAPAVDLKTQAEDAYKRIASIAPEDAKTLGQYLAALKNQNVMALGENEAFALRDEQGREIRATRKTVRLTAHNGELMQPVYNGPWVISAPGFMKLAHATGAVVMNAPTVTVDGRQEQNPYVRRDKDGRIIEIYCRAISFRYNENGQPMVSDRTTIFDVATYSIADMVAKASGQKEASKLLPAPAPAPGEEWAAYKVDDAINLWMNVKHDEAISFLGQVLNRQKKAMEFAQTFAQRNSLKHLLGVAVVPDNKPVWDVPVVCWQPSDGGLVRFVTARYAASTQTIDALSAGKPVALPEANSAIVISRGEDLIRGADMDEEADPSDNPDRYEGQEDTAPKAAAMMQPGNENSENQRTTNAENSGQMNADEMPENWSTAQLKDWDNLLVAREEFPTEYVKSLENIGLTTDDVTPATAGEINREINRLMDEF